MSELKTQLIPKEVIDPVKETFNQQFDELPVGGIMDLPYSMMKPTIPDDQTDSHSYHEEICVYRGKNGNIYIDDGNHRYYNQTLKEEIKANNKGQKANFDQITTKVRKVVPDPDSFHF